MGALNSRVVGLRAAIAIDCLLFGSILLAAAVMRFVNVGNQSGDLDEGVHGMQLLLMRAGYRPFQEIYASQGPLLLDLLYPFFQLYGGTLAAARLAVGTYSLIGVAGAYWVGHLLAGRLGAVLAALLLVLSPTYLRSSRQALAEVVAIGPAVLAVGAALLYQRSGRLRWLIGAGALLGLSLAIKPIAIAAAVPVTLAVLARVIRRPAGAPSSETVRRGGLRDLALLAAVVGGAILLVFLATGLSGTLEQIVEYRLRAREAQNWRLADNWAILRGSLGREQPALLGLAVLGGLALAVQAPRLGLPILLWGVAGGALLLFYTPLFPKHAVTLIPPAVILGGAGLACALHAFVGLRRQGGPRVLPLPRTGEGRGEGPLRGRGRVPVSQGLAALMILPLGWYLWSLPPTLAADGRLMRLGGSSEQEHFSDVTDAVQIISALSAPGDFVLTDHPYLALLAQRLVPPPLGDPSKTRVRARELTGADIAAAATEYPSKLAVLWSDRFLTLRAFRNWLEERYQPAKIYGRKGDSGRFIYIRKDADLAAARAVMTASLEQRSGAEFAGELRLGRFGLADSLIKRGDTTALELEWVAVKQLTADYHVIFKLVGPDGRVWDDEERSLFGRGEGADDWAPGRWVVQVTTIAPPEEAPSGEYRVIVGLYDSARRQSATLSTAPSGPHGFSERELLLAVLRVE